MNIQIPPGQKEIEAVLGLDARGRRKAWGRRVAWLAVAVAVAAGTAWWLVKSERQSVQVSYQTAPVTRQNLVVSVQATGNIQPTTEVDVSSERSGVLRSVNVDTNSMVKKGDVLAELDTERMMAELARDKASLASAEAKAADARATLAQTQTALARAERLSKQGISAIQDLDTARAAAARAEAGVAAADADVAVAQADITMQQTDITKTRILSPVDGIVLKRAAEPGQTVASSLQAPVLFTLAEDLTRMQLEADIDEADIGAVKPGQKATFTVDAYPGRAFPAAIEKIEFSPKVTDNVVTYKAVLTVDNSAMLLRPGMTATAQIVTQEVAAALTIANAALRYAPPKAEAAQSFSITNLFLPRMPHFEKAVNPPVDGERTVYVLHKGEPRALTVTTGASDGKRTEVLSGDLKDGDQVIIASRASGT